MAFLDTYRQQVALLIRTIPFVEKETAFALKGGTAINLFVRDMPRLADMARGLERDPQVESLLRNRTLDLGIDKDTLR